MKKKIWLIIAGVLILALAAAGGIWVIHTFWKTDNQAQKIAEITAVEKLTLRESGMRITQEYEILTKGDKAEISLYTFHYSDGKEERRLESSSQCDLQTCLKQLNDCKVGSWNGFHGKHPKNVLDGTMFTLEGSVNGGERLYADGSQNFPKHYHDFVAWLSEQLDK